MSEKKHTPGPWVCKRDESHFGSITDVVSDEIVSPKHPRHRLYASVGGVAGLSEQEANARLIAAAPDLYEACAAYYYGRKDARECEQMMGAALRKAVPQ